MKKCFALVLLALVPLLAYGCGGGSPSDVAKAFYKAGNAGKYSEAESYLSFEARVVYRQPPMFGVTQSFDNQMDAVTKGGTITRIDVEEGKDYGGYAVVLVTLHYDDGGQASDTLSLLKEDGQWRIVTSALLLTAH